MKYFFLILFTAVALSASAQSNRVVTSSGGGKFVDGDDPEDAVFEGSVGIGTTAPNGKFHVYKELSDQALGFWTDGEDAFYLSEKRGRTPFEYYRTSNDGGDFANTDNAPNITHLYQNRKGGNWRTGMRYDVGLVAGDGFDRVSIPNTSVRWQFYHGTDHAYKMDASGFSILGWGEDANGDGGNYESLKNNQFIPKGGVAQMLKDSINGFNQIDTAYTDNYIKSINDLDNPIDIEATQGLTQGVVMYEDDSSAESFVGHNDNGETLLASNQDISIQTSGDNIKIEAIEEIELLHQGNSVVFSDGIAITGYGEDVNGENGDYSAFADNALITKGYVDHKPFLHYLSGATGTFIPRLSVHKQPITLNLGASYDTGAKVQDQEFTGLKIDNTYSGSENDMSAAYQPLYIGTAGASTLDPFFHFALDYAPLIYADDILRVGNATSLFIFGENKDLVLQMKENNSQAPNKFLSLRGYGENNAGAGGNYTSAKPNDVVPRGYIDQEVEDVKEFLNLNVISTDEDAILDSPTHLFLDASSDDLQIQLFNGNFEIGQRVKITVYTDASQAGAVGLWSSEVVFDDASTFQIAGSGGIALETILDLNIHGKTIELVKIASDKWAYIE